MAAKSAGKIHFVERQDLLGPARDAHGLIADPLQVAVDLDHGQDEAQIDGHGLFLGEQLVGHLVQLALRGVDGPLVLLHKLAQALVAPQIGFHRGLDGLLRQRGHGQKLVLEFSQLLVKVNTRHCGFPPSLHCASSKITGVQISANAPEVALPSGTGPDLILGVLHCGRVSRYAPLNRAALGLVYAAPAG